MDELPFSKRKQTRRKSMDVQEFRKWVGNERSLQSQCENYLNVKGVFYIRIPDGIYKYVFSQYSKLPKYVRAFFARFVKGIPDLTILKPYGEKYNLALCIELKTEKGRLTQGQKNVSQKINVQVKRSLEDVVKEVQEFEEMEP